MIAESVEIATATKAGNSDAENEDAARSVTYGDHIRAAIADGATEASFSAEWAGALVDAWSNDAPLIDVWSRSRSRWMKDLPPRDSLPWYAQVKMEEGSAAAAVLCELRATRNAYTWSVAAIGDCELFVLTGRRRALSLVRAVPVQASQVFNNTPPLVRTTVEQPWTLRSGTIRGPSELWLATDALAKALLEAKERGEPAWSEWAAAAGARDTFQRKVDIWRERGRLKNDDTTLVRIRLL